MNAVQNQSAATSALEVRSFAGLPPQDLAPIVEGVLRDPYIADRVRHDNREPGFINHPNVTYYGAFVRGELVGLYCVISTTVMEVDLHAMLARRALSYARDLAHLIFARIFENDAITRITAHIVEGLESTRNHCLKVGFKYEGFRRDACRKSGRLLGIHMLGLTRTDWGAA